MSVTTEARPSFSASTLRSARPRCDPAARQARAPTSTPVTKPPIASAEAATEKPFAPAAANPMNTRLPVVVATNTCPRLRMLTASTTPANTVSASSNAGNGPCRSSITARLSAQPADGPEPLAEPVTIGIFTPAPAAPSGGGCATFASRPPFGVAALHRNPGEGGPDDQGRGGSLAARDRHDACRRLLRRH